MEEIIKLSVDKGFYPDTAVKVIRKKLSDIYEAYKSDIDLAVKLANIPRNLILSIIFEESGGIKSLVSSAGAVGLMQLKPQGANDTIFLENKYGRLSTIEKEYLRELIGDDRLVAILKQKYLGQKIKENDFQGNVITRADLTNSRFNILIGSMLLGLLIDQHTKDGKVRLDKALIRYGQGYFFKPTGDTVEQTLESVKNRKEVYNAVLKIMGKNGLLSIQES